LLEKKLRKRQPSGKGKRIRKKKLIDNKFLYNIYFYHSALLKMSKKRPNEIRVRFIYPVS